MKKTLKKIVEATTDSNSITDLCSNEACDAISPVADFFLFPETFLFGAVTYGEKALSIGVFLVLIIGAGLLGDFLIRKRFRENDHLQGMVSLYEKIMVVFLSFYGLKLLFYFLRFKS
ncbi:hypothetical protein [Rossellomorea marisflavi]|uniref:hypothetical protein n=1 Tax=Rossellomorea marisflavi TaxID=189381 RepID=UPI003D2ED266